MMSLFIMITIGITLCCNLLAGGLSYLILYTDVFKGQRIQKRGYRTSGIFWKRFPLVAFNLTLLMVITYGGLSLTEDLFVWTLPPSFLWAGLMILAQCTLLVVIDDAYFYWFHRTLHENRWLYQKIHVIHHRAFSPFPLEYIYVHPLEWMIGAGGIPLGLSLIYYTQGGISVWAFWLFAAWRNLHEIDIHSGLVSRWSATLPFFGTTEHHDQHHLKNSKGNYSSTFTFWDRLLGTDLKSTKRKKQRSV
jgi:sterol desaturase/sphingolipid hydroxylase (fatty acid hydroxylase superfamily)